MRSIEVFKTNVKGRRTASFLVNEMKEVFPGHKVSIDLDDSDKVLRVESSKGEIKASAIINLLEKRNFRCEVLND